MRLKDDPELRPYFPHLSGVVPDGDARRLKRQRIFTDDLSRIWFFVPPDVVVAVGFVFVLIGFFGVCALLHLPPAWQGFSYASLALNVNFLMIASVQTPLDRYSVPMIPVLFLVITMALTLLARLLVSSTSIESGSKT